MLKQRVVVCSMNRLTLRQVSVSSSPWSMTSMSNMSRMSKVSNTVKQTCSGGYGSQMRQLRQTRQMTESTQTAFYGKARRPSPAPRTAGERLSATLQHAMTALRDPKRADAVAAVGELTGHVALRRMHDAMCSHRVGRLILADRPVVSKATIPHSRLVESAAGLSFEHIEHVVAAGEQPVTFGQAYGSFLSTHGFDPDERDAVKFIEHPDLAYVMLRYRQCHDFYHVLTGLPPTVLGELALKWLELFQTGLPLAALSATVGSLHLPIAAQHQLRTHYIPWALQVAKHMPYGALLNVYYENEWDTNLTDLRHRLCIQPAPSVLSKEA